MSLWVYPPVEADALRKAQDDSLKRELDWLLDSLQASLASLKEGLEECVELLAPKEPGSTLVLSSLRSESVKGFVTRIGTKIVKGVCAILWQYYPVDQYWAWNDIHLRLITIPPNTPRTSTNSNPSTHLTITPSPNTPELILPQLLSVKSLINDSLDIIDVSRWTGQSTDASFMSGQLKLLHDHLTEAKACLKGPIPGFDTSRVPGVDWTRDSIDASISEPNIPGNLSLHFTIQDANLILSIRTLVPATPGGTPNSTDSGFSISGFNLRNRLLGIGPKVPNHDEMGEIFEWRGKQDVIVREKVRVETGDPSLMSVAAKLSALEHDVARCRLNLRIVMNGSDDED